jgi:hypothetical protein
MSGSDDKDDTVGTRTGGGRRHVLNAAQANRFQWSRALRTTHDWIIMNL